MPSLDADWITGPGWTLQWRHRISMAMWMADFVDAFNLPRSVFFLGIRIFEEGIPRQVDRDFPSLTDPSELGMWAASALLIASKFLLEMGKTPNISSITLTLNDRFSVKQIAAVERDLFSRINMEIAPFLKTSSWFVLFPGPTDQDCLKYLPTPLASLVAIWELGFCEKWNTPAEKVLYRLKKYLDRGKITSSSRVAKFFQVPRISSGTHNLIFGPYECEDIHLAEQKILDVTVQA